jgi:two-component system response regulator CitB
VIVEDEPHLAELHREYIEQNFHLRVVGIAASIEQAHEPDSPASAAAYPAG